MSLSDILFYIIAMVTCASALGVVFTRNIVRMAVWLLFTLIGVSLAYFLLGAEFVGASQLIIYVGGTMVLVVFGVMLTAQGPFQKLTSHPQEMVVGGILAVALFALLVNSALHMNSPSQPESTQKTVTVGALGSAFLNVPNVGATPVDGPQSAGSYKRHEIGYLLPFEIVSVHLLVVLIGAAYLARAKRKKPQTVIPAPMLESQDDRSDVRETLIH